VKLYFNNLKTNCKKRIDFLSK